MKDQLVAIGQATLARPLAHEGLATSRWGRSRSVPKIESGHPQSLDARAAIARALGLPTRELVARELVD